MAPHAGDPSLRTLPMLLHPLAVPVFGMECSHSHEVPPLGHCQKKWPPWQRHLLTRQNHHQDPCARPWGMTQRTPEPQPHDDMSRPPPHWRSGKCAVDGYAWLSPSWACASPLPTSMCQPAPRHLGMFTFNLEGSRCGRCCGLHTDGFPGPPPMGSCAQDANSP